MSNPTTRAGPPEATPAQPGAAPRVVHKPRRLAGDRGPAPVAALAWSSFFGSGYVPLAPGTAGTAAAIPLWWLLRLDGVPLWGVLRRHRGDRAHGHCRRGPRRAVLWRRRLGAHRHRRGGWLPGDHGVPPRSLFAALAGFVFFRACDVLKPWPARFFDRDPRWKNGAGVVLDDLFAGVWACALTWGALAVQRRFFPS